MSFLRIGATIPEYSHILSFRRQVYIAPTESTIPESLVISHEGLSYRIFLSLDSQKCFKCNQSGHIANNCRSTSQPSTSNMDDTVLPSSSVKPNNNMSSSIQLEPTITQAAEVRQTQLPILTEESPNRQTISTPQPILSQSKELNIEMPPTPSVATTDDGSNTGKRSFSTIVTPTSDVETSSTPTSGPTFIKPAKASLQSPMSFLRIGATIPEYSHILSFRRQVYIAPTESTIPESLVISHEGLSYRIFLSLDSQKCFKCNQSGHIANNCRSTSQPSTSNMDDTVLPSSSVKPNNNMSSSIQLEPTITQAAEVRQTQLPILTEESPNRQTISTPQPILSQSKELNIEMPPTPSVATTDHASNTGKRSFSTIVTPTSDVETSSTPTSGPTFIKPAKASVKKPKIDSQQAVISDQAYEPAKRFIDTNQDLLVLNSIQMKSLLENVHGTQNVISVVNEYT
ncbi:unnamed protein product [Acanthoscelides obtectus]|uniref:CCHC-type domain-containing protein n=1 Tax=Acanthoscelides obtectus TaxID=200917 RepID=A0A9P0KV79_ACAOB|nr:unnamed protein product [Acanthoscelides obtectus]CAK1640175.1 hypothetical protein AOBTE_LOCUS11576 [Acanthoscelides obtectus]